jgi:rare lipoprotein A
VPKNAKVLYTEVGYASWYGPGFQKRNAANGQPYDMNAMTAAHRTLPLSTIARVTDVKTGDSVLVRITDRGPFGGAAAQRFPERRCPCADRGSGNSCPD